MKIIKEYLDNDLGGKVRKILKPKSEEEIKKAIITREDKENLLWDLGFPKFDDYEYFIEELEHIFPHSDEIWMRLSPMADNYVGITPNERKKLRNNPREFLFEWEPKDNVLEYFMDVLTEEELNKAIYEILHIKLNEELGDILKPKGAQDIINKLIDGGSIIDKWAIVNQLFKDDYDKIYTEFQERGIENEDLIDAYIAHWSGLKRATKPEKIHWILSDILKDHAYEITDEMINNALL